MEVSGPLELNPVSCGHLTAGAREFWRVGLAAQLLFEHLVRCFEGQRGKETAQGELSPSWDAQGGKGEALHKL